MVLYTCTDAKALGGLPAPIPHPCGRAATAPGDAGHCYGLGTGRGGVMKVWTGPARARDRAEIERLSGQRSVPILVLDGGEVLTGSGAIVDWARENQPTTEAGSAA